MAFGILSFFCLGIASVSLAARTPSSSGVLHYEKFHGSFKDRMPQTDRKTLKAGMLFEENRELPKLPHGQLPAANTERAPLQAGRIISTSQIAFVSKVSTCIFQSVLNL